DGYPYGMAPEILKTSVLNQLGTLSEKNQIKISRLSIFELIQKDINSYDIETEISSIDQRMLRVSLSADTKRNFNQLSGIMDQLPPGDKVSEEFIVNILEKKQELLRNEPSFINVQITGGCPQACSYCPYPGIGGDITSRTDEMTIDQWKMILSKVKTYSDDAVFSISLWGEPSLHSNIMGIVEELLKIEKFRLIVETSGVGWDQKVLKSISEISDGRIEWILSLDAENPDSYKVLRGDGWEEANKTAIYLHELFQDKLYIQSVRMKDQEEYLENFYRSWKEKGFNVIIQKHDHFCGVLPDLRVTDLSPVKRHPCWHIKRDLNILIDGTVPMCREDLKKEFILGNIFTDELKLIWNNGSGYYLDHLSGNYPEICRECDEYYTYNF
ncbi:MAG: spiro-SPASM protein, partial [Spirochaetota bacterium]|nr:spiro-SPASM protein [Spirochaetota bacterium]